MMQPGTKEALDNQARGSNSRGGPMSILFVLLMFLLIISVRYFIEPKIQPALEPEIVAKPQPPVVKREYSFEIPQDYCFHLGHTWVMQQGTDNARVGVDKFVTNLMGKIDHIDVRGVDRWVRQGQKLITLTSNGTSIDLLSPIEGVVTAINDDALREPSLVANDPYANGWIAIVKSPDLKVNQKNLIQGSMVASWMQNNLSRLNAMVSPTPALAQDGGAPISGLLPHLAPEVRQKVVHEFFLT
jgi:glycine cleavage system H lipoate-binding protein